MSKSDVMALWEVPGRLLPSLRPDIRALGRAEHTYVVSLAWPLEAWPVIVPRPIEDSSDPLLRAVLRLAQAGCSQASTVAHWLGIHTDLAGKVIQALFFRSLIDNRGQPTKQGEEALARWETLESLDRSLPISGGTIAPDMMEDTFGYLLRDGVTGEILEIFCPELPEPLPFCPKGTIDLLPFTAVSAASLQHVPTPPQLRQGLRRLDLLSRQDIQESEGLLSQADGDVFSDQRDVPEYISPADDVDIEQLELFDQIQDKDDEEGFEAPNQGSTRSHANNKAVRRWGKVSIRLVNSEPERFHAECLLYIVASNPTDWHITPPLGGRGGVWHKQRLQWLAEQDKNFASTLNSWLRDAEELLAPTLPVSAAVGKNFEIMPINAPLPFPDEDASEISEEGIPAPESDGEETNPALLGVDPIVEEIWGQPVLTSNVTIIPETLKFRLHTVREYWHVGYRAYQLSKDDPAQSDFVRINIGKAIEGILSIYLDDVPQKEQLVYDLRAEPDLPAYFERIAREMGVVLPYSCRNAATGDNMKGVAKYGGKSIRDKALFLLADAYDADEADFAMALKRAPDLMHHLNVCTDVRNPAAHFDRNYQRRSVNEQLMEVNRGLRAARAVLVILVPTLCNRYINSAVHLSPVNGS